MKPFSYMRASSVDTAVAAASDKALFLGGGIDLLGELKESLVDADLLVAVARIPGLDAIEQAAGGWRIGANATVAAIASHPELARALPALTEAAGEVGSPQIRNVATLGGNLAQHSRCWYYRHRDVKCLKKGGSTCFAREGENKYHSLFSGNPCISPVVSNLAVALAALDAVVVVRRRSGEVRLSIADIYAAAWVNPLAHHSLAPGEMITAVEVPASPTGRSVYLQQSERSAFDWALVSCAAAAAVSGGTVQKARIVLGAVAPVPYRDERAEASLIGGRIDEVSAARAADLILEKAKPFAFNGYKIPVAHALIRRALLAIAT
jgi:xanthine dehydrogenase YagS FAD-binding subunit